MKIQKGMVKYKDRNDIICMYGVTDAGKTYYFLDNVEGKTFDNGNRVVSTELVEAIDSMVKASNVGVVDSNGNEVIACENKCIKSISDDVLLVEKATATTESVVQAIENRNDSLYAAQLVSTPAQIKDNIYKQMGNDGRFLFNDQFSEATVCDINGNNLVNDEVYSFVAINNDVLYLSKNLPDSPVEQLFLGKSKEENVDNMVVEDTASVDSTLDEEIVENVPSDEIDVNSVNVPVDVIEDALASQDLAPGNNVIQDNFDKDIHANLDNLNEGLSVPSTDDFLAATNLGSGIPIVEEDGNVESIDGNAVEEVVDNNDENVDVVENNDENEVVENNDENEVVVENSEKDEINEADAISEVSDNSEEENVNNLDNFHSDDEVVSIDDVVVSEEISLENNNISIEESETNSDDLVSDSVDEENKVSIENDDVNVDENVVDVFQETVEDEPIEEKFEEFTDAFEDKDTPLNESDIQSLFERTSLDLFNGGPLQIDSIVSENDDFDAYSFKFRDSRSSETLFEDLARSMTALIKQNREQRATIANYEAVIKSLNSSKNDLRATVAEYEHKNVELSDRIRSLENAVIKFKTRIEMLTTKVREKDDRIARQAVELERLRPQLEGRDQLIGLLKDAQALIGDNRGIDDIDDYGYSKVA